MNTFKVKDNTGEVLSALDRAKGRALKAIGMIAETYAKKELSKPKKHGDGTVRPNVDTGYLRNSITFAIAGKEANIKQYSDTKNTKTGTYSGAAGNDKEDAVYIGSNVEYAAIVELGGLKSRAYPYLKPAATEHTEEYKEILKNSLENA